MQKIMMEWSSATAPRKKKTNRMEVIKYGIHNCKNGKQKHFAQHCFAVSRKGRG